MRTKWLGVRGWWSASRILILTAAFCHLTSPASAETRYVSLAGSHASLFTNWLQAATSIQAAIDVSVAGDLVLVTNGVYSNGGRVVSGAMTNRVAIDRAIQVISINGPAFTTIVGARDPLTTNGNAAVRCAYVGTNAFLSGFTLAGGATRASGDSTAEQSGGGVLCASSASVTNCVITGNRAKGSGGGVSGGRLSNCTITSNEAANGGGTAGGVVSNCLITANQASGSGGGASGGILIGSTILVNRASGGGGTSSSTASNCLIAGNFAAGSGGGSSLGTLRYCALLCNTATAAGGGAFVDSGGPPFFLGGLSRCTLSGNVAGQGGGAANGIISDCRFVSNTALTTAGGVWTAILFRCTLKDNVALAGAGGAYGCTLTSCLIVGNRGGVGGAYHVRISGCTVADNVSTTGVGGVMNVSGDNNIVYHNEGPQAGNWSNLVAGQFGGTSISYWCTSPAPQYNGQFLFDSVIVDEPAFRDRANGDYRLAFHSPCIDAGSGLVTGVDLSGQARTLNGVVDIGAYESLGAVEARVILSGAYVATGSMRKALQESGTLPTNSPYAEDRRSANPAPSNAVDWVLLQLLETNAFTSVGSRSVLLRNDGELMDETGSTAFRIVGSASPVHLAVKHRNHNLLVTDAPVLTTGEVTRFDFTASAALFRDGTNAASEVEPGVWAMRAGDVDGDGVVTPADELIRATQE